jgi:hypothetical protein
VNLIGVHSVEFMESWSKDAATANAELPGALIGLFDQQGVATTVERNTVQAIRDGYMSSKQRWSVCGIASLMRSPYLMGAALHGDHVLQVRIRLSCVHTMHNNVTR